MTPDYFAREQYRDYVIYSELAKVERVPAFRAILEELLHQEFDDYQFWSQFSERDVPPVSHATVWRYKVLRKFLGLTFTAKLLEGHEKEMQQQYRDYTTTVSDESLRLKMHDMIAREVQHERHLISQINEEQVRFLSSIVLGLNDGLIELTGALVGFSFALGDIRLVALTGFITGLAASMSMAASAYMQAQADNTKAASAARAALYTGASYFVVVLLLVGPFVVFSSITSALAAMLVVALSIITAASFYTSVLFEKKFARQFSLMLVLSLGVAAVAFGAGLLLRTLFGVSA